MGPIQGCLGRQGHEQKVCLPGSRNALYGRLPGRVEGTRKRTRESIRLYRQKLGRRKCLPYRTPRRTQDQCLGTRRRGRVHSCSQKKKTQKKRKKKTVLEQ